MSDACQRAGLAGSWLIYAVGALAAAVVALRGSPGAALYVLIGTAAAREALIAFIAMVRWIRRGSSSGIP